MYFCYMKFVLEVKESKAAALMALLNDLPYVKNQTAYPYKSKGFRRCKGSRGRV